jgi:hypothetical protein
MVEIIASAFYLDLHMDEKSTVQWCSRSTLSTAAPPLAMIDICWNMSTMTCKESSLLFYWHELVTSFYFRVQGVVSNSTFTSTYFLPRFFQPQTTTMAAALLS